MNKSLHDQPIDVSYVLFLRIPFTGRQEEPWEFPDTCTSFACYTLYQLALSAILCCANTLREQEAIILPLLRLLQNLVTSKRVNILFSKYLSIIKHAVIVAKHFLKQLLREDIFTFHQVFLYHILPNSLLHCNDMQTLGKMQLLQEQLVE